MGRRVVTRVVGPGLIVYTVNGINVVDFLFFFFKRAIYSGASEGPRGLVGLARPFTITLYGVIICNSGIGTLTNWDVGMDKGNYGRNFAFAYFRFNGSTLIGCGATSGLGKRITRARRAIANFSTNNGNFKRGTIGAFSHFGSFLGFINFYARHFIKRNFVFILGLRGLFLGQRGSFSFFLTMVTRGYDWRARFYASFILCFLGCVVPGAGVLRLFMGCFALFGFWAI